MNFLPRERERYLAAANELILKRKEWTNSSHFIWTIFSDFIQDHEAAPFFDKLYTSRETNLTTDYLGEYRTNQNTVCLFFGHHPSGIGTYALNPQGRLLKSDIVLEHGGALVFSQAPCGDVYVLLKGCNSDVLVSGDPYLEYAHFKRPSDIKERHIYGAIKAFLWYNRITSVISMMTLGDAFKIRAYKLKANWFQLNWYKVLLDLFTVVGVIATIIAAIYGFFSYAFPKHP